MQSTPLKFYIADVETYPNCFVYGGKFRGDPKVYTFEISFRKNQRTELLQHLSWLKSLGVHMVTFNGLPFDWNIIDLLLKNVHTFDFTMAYNKAVELIQSQNSGFGRIRAIPLSEREIPQIDLMKIHHFDNPAKRTSLKALQFAMRSRSVEDLPFPVGTILTSEQCDELIKYNGHDLDETELFLNKSIHLIEIRKELLDTGVLKGDVLNFSDVKIGEQYLVNKIGRHNCYSGSKPKQTFLDTVRFSELLLPRIAFQSEEFEEVREWFSKLVVYPGKKKEEKDKIKLIKKLAGINFHFGLGGVHASVSDRKYASNDEWVIVDLDVTGMYVSVAIANEFAPQHLGKIFTAAYAQLKADRAIYVKGSVLNGILKLAGNGVFGGSGNEYSPWYDPSYLYRVTMTGQLDALALVERIAAIPQLQVIQANTDGVTIYMKRADLPFLQMWKTDWEKATGLALEEVVYDRMWIRDVNNYMAVTEKGKVKLKGAYVFPRNDSEYEGVWNKDWSMMIVAKAIEQYHIYGHKPEDIVRMSTDPFDFMMRYKTQGEDVVSIDGKPQPRTLRYYVSKKGGVGLKTSPPRGPAGQYKRKNSLTDEFYNRILKEIGMGVWDERIHVGKAGKPATQTKYDIVETSIEKGWLIKECNVADRFDWDDVDYDYYVEQINKLKIGETP